MKQIPHRHRAWRSFPSLARGAALVALLATVGWVSQAQRERDPAEWNSLTAFPDRVVLTWSGDPATTQSVTWRTDTTVSMAQAQVTIATDGPAMGRSAVTVRANTERLDTKNIAAANLIAHYHSVTFTGLLPDTLYAYRVGDGTRWTEWYQFRTASRRAAPFSFLYVGDAQNDILSLWSRVIRQGFRSAPDMRFIVHAGDLVNDANADVQWGEWFRAGGFIHAMVPSVPVPGNHEYRARTAEQAARGENELSAFWRPQFTLPTNGIAGLEESNYWFDYQGVRFVALNSNREHAPQAAWLRRVLKDNPHPWTIAIFHHPIFSAARERDNAELRALWKPVFDSTGVDLVLQGHDHTYARGRTPALGRNVATGVNARDALTGTVYVVSVSGAKMYDASKDDWGRLGASLERQAENTQLYQVIRIAGDTLHYQARTATGALYDAFDLVRRGKSNRFVERVPRNAPARTMRSAPPYRVVQPDTTS